MNPQTEPPVAMPPASSGADPRPGGMSSATMPAAGDVIGGRYKLLEQIGEGGFGVVFLAEQEHPVRRRVALKLIKLGMDTRQVIARFEALELATIHVDVDLSDDSFTSASPSAPSPSPTS